MELVLEQAWLAAGFARNVRLVIDDRGFIATVEPDADPAGLDYIQGLAIPGMINAHSHAFQRMLAGLTEFQTTAEDSFWTWRQAMYDFVQKLTPDHVHKIACQLYGEALKAGYTHMVEFHYLHHTPSGAFYDPETAMADAVIGAAQKTGIGLTLLPVLYQASDFGGEPPLAHQKRFVCETGGYLDLLETLRDRTAQMPNITIGAAFHSLRAVPEDAVRAVLENLPDGHPIHIHIAEQEKEVAASLAYSGKRPVDWLLDHVSVDGCWSLVHATHMTESETAKLAASGATAILCPTTEANLGDGLFPLTGYLARGGAIAIGSDSHISVSPIEELRLLEYGQRLTDQVRNLAATKDEPHTGAALWKAAARGGAKAAGIEAGQIAPGQRADLVILNLDSPSLYGRTGGAIIDSLVFAGNVNPVRHIMVGGKWRVKDGSIADETVIFDAYKDTVQALTGGAA